LKEFENKKFEQLFPIVRMDLNTKKAVLNDTALASFKNSMKDVTAILKRIYLNENSVECSYIGDTLYFIKLIKDESSIDILFISIDNKMSLLNRLTDKQGENIDLYPKDALKEFLTKFLALKKRYGGFFVEFLYMKVEFLDNMDRDAKIDYVHDILKYTLGVIRSSDVLGQISDNSFGLILTQAEECSMDVVTDKILKFITTLNYKSGKLLLEVYGSLGKELLLIRNLNFDELIDKLDEKSKLITVGSSLPVIFK
jgi:hypothetical protein